MRAIVVLALCLLQNLAAMAQKDHFFVYLCFGQTNMVGHGQINPDEMPSVDDFYAMSAINGKGEWKAGKWRKAVAPLCGPDSGASLVDFFGDTMRRNLPKNIKIGVIFVAVDDADIDLFDKDVCKTYIKGVTDERMKAQIEAYGGNPYSRLISIAKKAQKNGEIRGILMHHGETTSCNEEWVKKVCKIHDNLMHDLKLDPAKVPFVVGETVDTEHGGRYAASNTFINQLSGLLPSTYVASAKGCEASADKLHFLTSGYHLLGVRYAVQMLRGMGLGFEGSDDYYMMVENKNSEEHKHEHDVIHEMIDVKGKLSKDGRVFHVEASMPVITVHLLDDNRKPCESFDFHGQTKLDVDVSSFPITKNPLLEFVGANGSSVEVEVIR